MHRQEFGALEIIFSVQRSEITLKAANILILNVFCLFKEWLCHKGTHARTRRSRDHTVTLFLTFNSFIYRTIMKENVIYILRILILSLNWSL